MQASAAMVEAPDHVTLVSVRMHRVMQCYTVKANYFIFTFWEQTSHKRSLRVKLSSSLKGIKKLCKIKIKKIKETHY